MQIGVLALQGDFVQHARAVLEASSLMNLDVRLTYVKKASDLENILGLVIPGGESTTIGSLMRREGLDEKIREKYYNGELTILATCAGLILLAKEISDAKLGETSQSRLGLLDISVVRNAFGRQKESFEAPVLLTDEFLKMIRRINEEYSISLPLEHISNGVFIRAPVIDDPKGAKTIARLQDDKVVGVIDKRIIALAFHPELTDELRFHAAFLDMIKR